MLHLQNEKNPNEKQSKMEKIFKKNNESHYEIFLVRAQDCNFHTLFDAGIHT